MIYGIGTDIVRVARMSANVSRYGERFARKILADEEMQAYHVAVDQGRFLAKRFAAKEAVVKAMGTGFRDGISMHHIAVRHDELGKPLLHCSGRMQDLMGQYGVTEGHLSLSDEQEYAIAFAVLIRSFAR